MQLKWDTKANVHKIESEARLRSAPLLSTAVPSSQKLGRKTLRSATSLPASLQPANKPKRLRLYLWTTFRRKRQARRSRVNRERDGLEVFYDSELDRAPVNCQFFGWTRSISDNSPSASRDRATFQSASSGITSSPNSNTSYDDGKPCTEMAPSRWSVRLRPSQRSIGSRPTSLSGSDCDCSVFGGKSETSTEDDEDTERDERTEQTKSKCEQNAEDYCAITQQMGAEKEDAAEASIADQFAASMTIQSATSSSAGNVSECALNIPEILHKVLQYVDSNNIPQERPQKRRRPMSLRHALLIYGDPITAKEAYNGAGNGNGSGYRSSSAPTVATTSTGRSWAANGQSLHGAGQGAEDSLPPPNLLACMLVCKHWYHVASDVLYETLYFRGNCSWERFVISMIEKNQGQELDRIRMRPSTLVLHKCALANQPQIKTLSKMGGNLQWLEFYTCPMIVPTPELVRGGQIRRLVLPGCTNLNDRALSVIAEECPLLEHLDLRACDMVSDAGVKAVARNCSKLKLLNVGRTHGGELITYHSIKHIAKRTSIETLGLAGCSINDRAIWALALYRGPYLHRLSLNNCHLLTNESIPRMLPYMYNLTVLELRGCVQITEMRPIVQFKRYRELQGHPPLIEGCEVFDLRLKEAEWMMEIEVSRQVVEDCLEWIYSPDDDVDYS